MSPKLSNAVPLTGIALVVTLSVASFPRKADIQGYNKQTTRLIQIGDN